jgi:LDH2 family malate/lactate/ureidoglycolate dehydrogenase
MSVIDGTPTRLLEPVGLGDLTRRILVRVGTAPDIAEVVAASLVGSNERGVDSHGCIRIPEYVQAIERGSVDPKARPSMSRDGNVIRVAGNRGFGQPAAREMTLVGVQAAQSSGVALATLNGVRHIGRLGEFVELAAARGCIAFMTSNSGPPGGLVAPFGGRRRALGTNPLAFAIPAGKRPAIVADFSTSVAAEGKVRLYRHAGRPLPEGWLIDAGGRPSRDPDDLYAGGAILPATGYKGFALGLMVELLGGVLAGEGCASTGDDPGNGVVLVIIDVTRFRALDAFGSNVDVVIEALQSVPPAAGFDQVVVPGAPEVTASRERNASGIPVLERTWMTIVDAARRLGVGVDERALLSPSASARM